MARFFPILRAAVLANIDCQNVRELVAFVADGHAGHSTGAREIRKARIAPGFLIPCHDRARPYLDQPRQWQCSRQQASASLAATSPGRYCPLDFAVLVLTQPTSCSILSNPFATTTPG